MRIPFDNDATPRGVEGWLEIKSDTLVVFANPTSNKFDWFVDFLAFPVPTEWFNWKLGLCHVGFKSYAYWLTGVIYKILSDNVNVTKVTIAGYSMGGGIAQLTAVICNSWICGVDFKVLSIDGPRTTTVLPKGKLVRNKHSLVADIPPWFKKLPETILSTKKRPFWKAHADYDIEEILK